jgi:hypothetical protein
MISNKDRRLWQELIVSILRKHGMTTKQCMCDQCEDKIFYVILDENNRETELRLLVTQDQPLPDGPITENVYIIIEWKCNRDIEERIFVGSQHDIYNPDKLSDAYQSELYNQIIDAIKEQQLGQTHD